MLNPFKNFMSKQTQTISTTGYSPFMLNGTLLSTNTVDADGALQNSDIYAVINRIAGDVASCEFKTDQYSNMLNQPSTLLSAYNFWQAVSAQMMLTGNAFALIQRNGNGSPAGLTLIPFYQVSITLDNQQNVLYYTVNYGDDRGQVTYLAADILHFRLFVSGQVATELVGSSPLNSLAKEINIQNYSNQLSLSSLKNAIAPSYTITVPAAKLEPEAKENIRKSFEKQNSGANAGRPIVLDQSAQLDSLQINPDIAKLLNNATFSQTQIAKAFCVPDSYLNGQGDEQSSIDMIRSLYQNSLSLYIRPIESELSLKLGIDIKMDINSAIDVDHQQLISNITKLSTGQSPALTPQQAQTILKQAGVFPDLKVSAVEGGDDNDNSTN
ncbi:phage portal protein [Lentilactobacillus parabuchneri]|uniref:phage portal protein n=1 Tax=Lentilactobacillus parabuchneri TaxID=152331 RepID=UPI000A10B296|nr:phage portal protein [Lentilactobacillus parabuchneri]ORN03111.1 Phage portal protein [Lentilactobacillus parabuchneri]